MEYKALKDIAQITMGQSPDSSSYNEEGRGLPFFQGNADFGELYPTERVWCDAPKKVARANDILISVRAPIGAMNYAREECCIGRGLAAISIEDPAERQYIFHLLKARHDELNRKGTGSTFKAINKSVLEDLQVPVISLAEKQHAMQIMDSAEQIIRKRKEELKHFDELIKARFVEMFGDPLSDTGKWPIHTVGDVANSVDPQPSHRTPPVDESGIPYVSIKDCDYKTGKIDFENARKVGRNVLDEHLQRYELHDGDFIIGKIGTIGNPIFVPARRDYTLSANIVLIQPDKEKVSPYFLKYSFMSAYMDRQFEEAKNSTSQAAFGIQKVRAIKVMNPPINIQYQFEAFAKQVDKSKVAVQKSLDEMQVLFDSLMQEYFG